jgi:hypothetical protein
MNLVTRVGLVLVCAALTPAKAAEPKLPRDGWVSWQVAAVDGAPSWCCFPNWNDRDPARRSCNLDGGRNNYGTRDSDPSTDTVKIYARQTGGRLDRLQVLSAACPVETKTPIQPLGDVAPEDSIRWLVAQAKQDRRDAATGQPIGENALAALAMHRGDPARDAMVGFTRDPRVETRKGSMFWLAMVRGAEAESERAITAALRNDADEEVREQAVFALSRLPDERATRALIGIAEDQSLPREQRRRAVFWLAQSESDSAQAYLEKVLARNAR